MIYGITHTLSTVDLENVQFRPSDGLFELVCMLAVKRIIPRVKRGFRNRNVLHVAVDSSTRTVDPQQFFDVRLQKFGVLRLTHKTRKHAQRSSPIACTRFSAEAFINSAQH